VAVTRTSMLATLDPYELIAEANGPNKLYFLNAVPETK